MDFIFDSVLKRVSLLAVQGEVILFQITLHLAL